MSTYCSNQIPLRIHTYELETQRVYTPTHNTCMYAPTQFQLRRRPATPICTVYILFSSMVHVALRSLLLLAVLLLLLLLCLALLKIDHAIYRSSSNCNPSQGVVTTMRPVLPAATGIKVVQKAVLIP